MLLEIIIASTREGRSGHRIGQWFEGVARRHSGFEIELIDLATVALPLFDEPVHPRLRQYKGEHTKSWSATVERADAYVLVTPEYNYAPPPSLVNALDFLVHEWGYKPVGFVSYGGLSGGTRSVQMTKLIVTALKMMPMVEAVNLPFYATHLNKETGAFEPPQVQEDAGRVMLDELARWAAALQPMRVAR
ncbi:MAG: NAD(P)H-dependent oxidoreductase [Pseudomonadota bacterium]|nr:NAD(P)H-dependent oxidoreductase [Pseudomonadota bacterium]